MLRFDGKIGDFDFDVFLVKLLRSIGKIKIWLLDARSRASTLERASSNHKSKHMLRFDGKINNFDFDIILVKLLRSISEIKTNVAI